MSFTNWPKIKKTKKAALVKWCEFDLSFGRRKKPTDRFFSCCSRKYSSFHTPTEKRTWTLVGILVILLATETFALHILLLKWSEGVAWLTSLSSVYLGLLFLAQYKATWQRQPWIDESPYICAMA